MNKLIAITIFLLFSTMFSLNNAFFMPRMMVETCKLQPAPTTNDANDNGVFNMNVKLYENGKLSPNLLKSTGIKISKGNSYSFWDNYNVYYSGEKLYVSYKYITGIMSQAYLEDCKSNSTIVSTATTFSLDTSRIIIGQKVFCDKIDINFTKL